MAETTDWVAMTKMFESQVKGEDPSDLKQKCLCLCQQYLVGNWTKLTADDVEIKRLTGGLMNMVYHCRIPDNLRDNSNEPKEVAIRIFGEKYDFHTLEVTDNTLEDNIKYVLLSENGFGPKVYGVAQTAIIQKYYQHRHFIEDDLHDKDLLDQVAIKLAHLHSMRPPIEKTLKVESLMVSCNRWFCQKLDVKRKLFEKYNCKTLLDFDLKAETDWILSKSQSFDSPIVFSHNDFRFGNTMVTAEDGIVIGDFDISGFYYRGFDFATFFTDFIEFDENSIGFKDESIVRTFIGKYLTESAIINGKQYLDNKINSIEHIMNEIKVCDLVHSTFQFNVLLDNEKWKLPLDDSTNLQIVSSAVERYLVVKKLLGDF